MRQTACPVSFDCHFPEGNIRFEKVGVPRAKTQTVIVGFISATSLPITTTSSVKRIPLEVGEIQYLASSPLSSTTPLKGLLIYV
jgi:hypothetical protein